MDHHPRMAHCHIMVPGNRRRLHQLPVRAQPHRRTRTGLQHRRARRGILQLPVDDRTRSHLARTGNTPRGRSPMAVHRLHRRHARGHDMVGRAAPMPPSPQPRHLDVHRTHMQQRHLCSMDFRRRIGNPTVYLLHRPRSRPTYYLQAQSSRTTRGIHKPGARVVDPPRRRAHRRKLLRVVRTPKHRRSRRCDRGRCTLYPNPSRLPHSSSRKNPFISRADTQTGAPLPDSTVRGDRGRAPTLPLRILRRIATQHLLRKVHRPMVRHGHPLPNDGRLGHRVVSAAATRRCGNVETIGERIAETWRSSCL